MRVSFCFWEKRKVLKSLQQGEARNQRAVVNLLAGRLRWIKGFLRPKSVASRGRNQFILSLEVPLAIQRLSPGDSGSPLSHSVSGPPPIGPGMGTGCGGQGGEGKGTGVHVVKHSQNPPSPSSGAGPPSLCSPQEGLQGPKAQVQVSLWLSSSTQLPSQPAHGPWQPQLAGPACSGLGFSFTTAWQFRTWNLLTVLFVTSVSESAAPCSRRCCGEKLPGQGGAHPPLLGLK